MNFPETSPWIYAGNCPICECGLRRIRVSRADDGQLHGYVMCDECEAIWLSPDRSSPYKFPDPDEPRSPVIDAPLYGSQSRWATVDDVRMLHWIDQVTVDFGETGESGNYTPPRELLADDSSYSDHSNSQPDC